MTEGEREVRQSAGARAAAGTLTWRHLYSLATERLGSDIEARRIVERTSGREGADWLLTLDEPVPTRAVPFFDDMVERRAAGEPLQYVLRRWGFRTLDLLVDERVLIPRPETEVVVEVAIRELRRIDSPQPLVVDLGTGSGAIALSIAAEAPTAHVWATDASEDALAVASANLAGIGAAAVRVRTACGRWFEALPAALRGQFDLVVSNPPYIAEGEVLPSEVVDWEPRTALVAGPAGTEAVADVVTGAVSWLAPGGAAVVEIAPHQADDAMALARAAGFADADVRPDLNGRARVLVARR
ncbi:MAG: peptide chain release factor N(5)-glutamine methyltransferase [Acidimicrobiia bacterium]|nr:peptide chain release factor N(5)-glutamine methyltransferase [Acidimicrobiia bacterium]MBV9040551.1 peptide chain release factor N(5)-glutamine methyltransferase [Acidimicrobiia bacterium]